MPREDLLRDGRPRKQSGDHEREVRRHWDQRRAEGVLTHGGPLAKALGSGGAHVVGTQRVQHQVALVTRVGGNATKRHGDGWK